MTNRRFLLLTTAFSLALSLSACGGRAQPSSNGDDRAADTSAGQTSNDTASEPGYPGPDTSMAAQAESGYPAPADAGASAGQSGDTASGDMAAAGQDAAAADEGADTAASDSSASSSSEAGTTTYEVVSDASEASYSVNEEFFAGAVQRLGRTLGKTTTTGSTKAVEGSLTLRDTPDGPVLDAGEFRVDLSTLTSDSQMRDRRMRETLNTSANPEAVFTAKEMSGFPPTYEAGAPVTFQLVGELTVNGVTQPATFNVTATMQDSTITGQAQTTLMMSDFGVTPPDMINMLKVGDETTLTLNLKLAPGSVMTP